MSLRSLAAFVILAHYLLLAGVGGIMRPYEQPESVFIQTYEGQHYQECRYLRMDGLEDFLKESLASRYQNSPSAPRHHVMAVVMAVEVHCLPDIFSFSCFPAYRHTPKSVSQPPSVLASAADNVSPPPKKA
ncbi:MAG: hypothetical protein U0X91_00215 [Spirosomataceae bacterium]